ncbi:hypothetical protein AYI69_g6533, partial [Smittium culicis]
MGDYSENYGPVYDQNHLTYRLYT